MLKGNSKWLSLNNFKPASIRINKREGVLPCSIVLDRQVLFYYQSLLQGQAINHYPEWGSYIIIVL